MAHPSLSTSAGRLWHLLNSIRTFSGVSTREAWTDIFDIDPSDSSELLRRYGKVLELPHQIRYDIDNNDPRSAPIYADMLLDIETHLISSGLQKDVEMIKRIDKSSMKSLQLLDHYLNIHKPDEKTLEEELIEIEEESISIREIIKSDDPDDKESRLIGRFLDRIEESVRDFEISGTENIRSVGKSLMIDLSVSISSGQANPRSKPIKRLASLIKKLCLIGSLLSAPVALTSDAINVFEFFLPEAASSVQIEDADVITSTDKVTSPTPPIPDSSATPNSP